MLQWQTDLEFLVEAGVYLSIITCTRQVPQCTASCAIRTVVRVTIISGKTMMNTTAAMNFRL